MTICVTLGVVFSFAALVVADKKADNPATAAQVGFGMMGIACLVAALLLR